MSSQPDHVVAPTVAVVDPAAIPHQAPSSTVTKAAWLSNFSRNKRTIANWREATHEGRRMMVRRCAEGTGVQRCGPGNEAPPSVHRDSQTLMLILSHAICSGYP